MDTLKNLKLLKGITDDLQDNLLELVIKQSKSAVLSKINSKRSEKIDEVPSELEWVVLEVAAKRFNRLNSEGTKKHSQEGETFEWDDLLAEYEADFEPYYDKEKEESKARTGVLRIWR